MAAAVNVNQKVFCENLKRDITKFLQQRLKSFLIAVKNLCPSKSDQEMTINDQEMKFFIKSDWTSANIYSF